MLFSPLNLACMPKDYFSFSNHFFFFFRANPYQKIVQILGRILEPFMEPNCVYAYGFGDAVSQDISVFNLLEDEDSPCLDFKQGDSTFFANQK